MIRLADARRVLRLNTSGTVPDGDQANVLIYGEFDSGSERTLAAWIRHASRTLIDG